MIMRDVSIIMRKMRVHAEHALADEGIGFPEQQVLMCLIAHGDFSQERIARYLDIDKGAVAKTVAKLEGKGYVERTVNPENKREKLVVATDKATRVFDKMKRGYDVISARMFSGLSQDEVEQLQTSLRTIAENLSLESEN